MPDDPTSPTPDPTLFAEDSLASLSHRQEDSLLKTTPAISGQRCLELSGNSGPLGLLENVVGLIKLGLDEVLTDLEGEGYATRTFNIPACATGAPHLRQRIWVVAHADSQSEPDGTFDGNAGQRQLGFGFVADSDDDRGQERHAQRPEQDRQEQTGDAVSRGSSVSDPSGHTDRRRGNEAATEPEREV